MAELTLGCPVLMEASGGKLGEPSDMWVPK